MGSTTSEDQQQLNSGASTSLSKQELENLLELREREISLLKFELEKYKLALSQSQCQQFHKSSGETGLPDGGSQSLLGFGSQEQQSGSSSVGVDLVGYSRESQLTYPVATVPGGTDDTLIPEDSSLSKELSSQSTRLLARQSTASLGSNVSASSSSKVVLKTGTDDEQSDDNVDDEEPYISSSRAARDHKPVEEISGDALQDIIQDVGEIDLNIELKKERKKKLRMRKSRSSCDKDGEKRNDKSLQGYDERSDADDFDLDDDEDDIISDGLLTSLTDAAISNLNQLAALQERCESQQNNYPQQSQSSRNNSRSQAIQQQLAISNLFSNNSATDIPLSQVTTSTSIIGTRSSQGRESADSGFNRHDPFSPSNLANQAAIAISAAAAAVAMRGPPSSMLTHSSSSSLSPNSNIQADLNSGHSLASVVAAAAAAAAAANDQHHQQQSQSPAHQSAQSQQSRLISSALSSPEFYNLHQHQQRAHPQQHPMSPLSSLHYSHTASITPPSSSLIAQSRRSGSNTSSSFMSPTSSSSYIRRQFIPDRSLMTQSTNMAAATGGGVSNSLAQILQQHQQGHQQRSASALAGPISSQSSTPMSGTGSVAMSPLIGSKSSSQARLNNMQIRHKFGYLGSGRGQFNSPHGFCLGLNQEIVVADTNNHRICIFDKSGSYITQFGSPGKDEGQLWNPRKVAILHRPLGGVPSGNQAQKQHQGHVVSTYSSHFTSAGGIQNTTSGVSQFASDPLYVVCDRGAERSRMQLFTKEGLFIKKIGIHYIDIVAGLAITQNGLIIVVDSVSPTVYIINAETGALNGWFDCSGHMKEPSDIAVKSDVPSNEYFICDFKGHCVVVFSEQGEYLRKIGHDGLTSYPNGIDISDDGDILVGDSHGNRFHVVVFDRNGNFVSQFECPHVKVSRCCGLKITREGYIVTLAKNNHHVLVLDTIHI